MNQDTISVIVPIYKAEKYIRKCVTSIIEQTYSNLEIILIDDESPDKCGSICDSYKDERIKVIHKQNESSAGLTRNVGIEIATGKYIAFVDADDYIEKSMIEKLYSQLVSNNADASFCGYNIITKKHCIINEYDNKCYCEIYNRSEIEKQILPNIIYTSNKNKNKCIQAVWAALYKKDIIKKYNIQFFNEKNYYSEDIIFNYIYLSKCNKIVCINEKLYNYNTNSNSMTKNYSSRYNYINEWYTYLVQYSTQNNLISKQLLDKLNTVFLINNIYRIKQEVILKKSTINNKIKEINNIINDDLFNKVLNNTDLNKFNIKRKVILKLAKRRMVKTIYILSLLNR